MAKEQNKKTTVGPSDEEIIEGLRDRDPQITRDYFYGVCRIAYHIYNKRYELDWKVGLDFYSIAHEYYLSLDKHDFRQLEDRKPSMTLKSWMINGFRFVLLDRLKNYNKEHRLQSFEERMEKASLRFDVPDNNFSEDFRNTVYEICSDVLGRDHRSSIILQMMLIEGFKGKEVAAQLGITKSSQKLCAIKSSTQRCLSLQVRCRFQSKYHQLWRKIIPTASHPNTSPHSSPTRFSFSAATSPVCTEAVPHGRRVSISALSLATATARRVRAMPFPPCRAG